MDFLRTYCFLWIWCQDLDCKRIFTGLLVFQCICAKSLKFQEFLLGVWVSRSFHHDFIFLACFYEVLIPLWIFDRILIATTLSLFGFCCQYLGFYWLSRKELYFFLDLAKRCFLLAFLTKICFFLILLPRFWFFLNSILRSGFYAFVEILIFLEFLPTFCCFSDFFSIFLFFMKFVLRSQFFLEFLPGLWFFLDFLKIFCFFLEFMPISGF